MSQGILLVAFSAILIASLLCVGVSAWFWLRVANISRTFSAVLALGMGAFITIYVPWYFYRAGRPLYEGMATVFTLATISALAFLMYAVIRPQVRQILSEIYLHLVSNWQYAIVYLFFSSMMAWLLLYDLRQEDLPLVTVGNADLFSYIKSAQFLNHSSDANILESPWWPQALKIEVFGAFVLLDLASFLTQLPPWQTTLIPIVAAAALLGTSCVWICRITTTLPWVTACAVSLLLLATPLFSVILFSYFLSQMIHNAALSIVVGALICSQSSLTSALKKSNPAIKLAFAISVYGGIVLFTYNVLYFPDMMLMALLLFVLFIISEANVSVRNVMRSLLVSMLIIALAVAINLLISPDRFITVINRGWLATTKDIAGWPLPLFSGFSLVGLPTPFGESISIVQQGASLIVQYLLLALLVRLTIITAMSRTAALLSVLPIGVLVFLQTLYVGVSIFYGPSYQQWKFASSYPLVFGFSLLANGCAILVASLSKSIRKYAYGGVTIALILLVVSNIKLSAAVWHNHVLHFPRNWEALSRIDELAQVDRIVVGFDDIASRMLAAAFIKHKKIVFGGPTYFSLGESNPEISPTSPYLQWNACESDGSLSLGPFVLRPERMPRIELRQPLKFSDNRITSCIQLTGVSAREDWGRWTDGPLARISLRCNCRADEPHWLVIRVIPYGEQHVEARVNGFPAGSWSLKGQQPSELRISLAAISDFTAEIHVDFSLPNAVAPAATGFSADRRRLALGLLDLVLK